MVSTISVMISSVGGISPDDVNNIVVYAIAKPHMNSFHQGSVFTGFDSERTIVWSVQYAIQASIPAIAAISILNIDTVCHLSLS